MGYESNTGLGVTNHYGEFKLGNVNGVHTSRDREVELNMDLNGEAVTNGGPLTVDFKIPAGADITRVYLVVTKVATFGNADNVVDVGTDTTEATNGFTITDAQLAAIATTDLTSELSGTWAAPLAAATTVGFAVSGTTASMTGGLAKVIIKYNITAV
jgi:hypothetical protein